MKLHHLRDVVAIAERGSLRGASRHLQLAQPALTRSLGQLERELGASLFERNGRGMALTMTGQAFVQRASAILHEVRRAQEEVSQLRDGVSGSVTLALSIAAHTAMLPSALGPFRRLYPAVRLTIIEGIYPTVENRLRDGGIDFYIGPEPEQPLPPGLRQEVLFANTRVVVARHGHPLAGARSLAELAGAEWASTSVTLQAGEEFAALFQSLGLAPPRLALQSQSALTLMVSLTCSELLAMVPVQFMASGATSHLLQVIPVKEVLPAPPIVLIQRAGLPLTPAATRLADLLRKAQSAKRQRARIQGPMVRQGGMP